MEPSNPLAPVFAASLAVQQLLEVLSVPVQERVGELRTKPVLGVIGFVIGLVLAYVFELNVMAYFKVPNSGNFLDKVVTALILSAGTEGMNSLVKFLKYLKEDKKASAAETLQSLRDRTAGAVSTGALSGAKGTLEKLRRAAGRAAPAPQITSAEVPRSPAFVFMSKQ